MTTAAQLFAYATKLRKEVTSMRETLQAWVEHGVDDTFHVEEAIRHVEIELSQTEHEIKRFCDGR